MSGRFILSLGAACLVSACVGARTEGREVVVYAAASLADALSEVGEVTRKAGGPPVDHHFAGTASLAQSIRRAGPADIFISANPAWMDRLEGEGFIEPGTRRDLLGNRLVLVASPDAPLTTVALDGPPPAFDGRLALADPDAIPAGQYARRALERLGWWQDLAPRVAGAADVRGALALVARGECELGAVYRTDVRVAPEVRVVATFSEAFTGRIVYPVAAVEGRLRPDVRAYLDALDSPAAREVFTRHGFVPLDAGRGLSRSPESP
jgi:molybdate transport system substrate-binding protein